LREKGRRRIYYNGGERKKNIAKWCYSELSNMKVYCSSCRKNCYFKRTVGGRKTLNLTKKLR
jgi:hypothetical protein